MIVKRRAIELPTPHYLFARFLMLLGRTANGLYWMNRYIERAENMARLLDAGLRMALTRSENADEEWTSVVVSAGAEEAFRARHSEFTVGDRFGLPAARYRQSVERDVRRSRRRAAMRAWCAPR